jgi:nucleotide-binding universal stress UspA family protein
MNQQKRLPQNFQRILVTLDGSAIAERSLDFLGAVARAPQSIFLLQAIPTPPPANGVPYPQEELAEELQSSREYLAGVCQRLEQEGHLATPLALLGNPVGVILDQIEQESIDLVLMTSHGRTGLSRLLNGSVAEQVCREAGCPVLMIGRASLHDRAESL